MSHRDATKVRQMKRGEMPAAANGYNEGYLDKDTVGGSGRHDAGQDVRDDEKTVANPSPGAANP